MPREFKGTIKLDVRDSKPDWDAFLATKSPKDAPNVLVILYDDTGQAAWSPYGRQGRNAGAGSAGEKRTHLYAVAYDRRLLADAFVLPHGAQPSPERLWNDLRSGDRLSRLQRPHPSEHATIAHVLRDAGWSTFWIGKNHNVPVDAFDMAATRKAWPLGLGYDRFYGFRLLTRSSLRPRR